MRKLSRRSAASIRNDAAETINVAIDDDVFLLPPAACLQISTGGMVYLTYAGDAPMLAWPIRRRRAAA